MRVQVLCKERRCAGNLGSGAEVLLHPLTLVVCRALQEAVRPATDIGLFVDARTVQRVVRDKASAAARSSNWANQVVASVSDASSDTMCP